MTLQERMEELIVKCKDEVAALDARIPNYTAKDGTVTVFVATDVQIGKLASRIVTAANAELEQLAVSDIVAAVKAELRHPDAEIAAPAKTDEAPKPDETAK